MSGVMIAGELLTAHAPLIAEVPPEQMAAWMLPQGTPLPSLVATRVSRTEQQLLGDEPTRFVTDRVQVTVRARSGSAREALLRLVVAACDRRRGTIAGYVGASLLFAGLGPDFMDDAASIFMGSADFRVSFNEPR